MPLREIKMYDPASKIEEYFQDKRDVVAVYLFGSYAAGKNRPDSDMDLGIIFNQELIEESAKMRMHYMIDLGRLFKKEIHVTILNTASEMLLRQVFLRGRCVLNNNPRELALFRMTAYSKIVDFEYYKNQMKSGFIRKIIEA